jgi:hypothetical protein
MLGVIGCFFTASGCLMIVGNGVEFDYLVGVGLDLVLDVVKFLLRFHYGL